MTWLKFAKGGIGIGLLPAPTPLIIAISLIFRVQFAHLDEVLYVHAPLSMLLLAANLRVRFPRIFVLALSTTFLYLFFGNAIFLSGSCSEGTYFFSEFGKYGCAVGAAIPRTVMLIYGFAWLNSGDSNQLTLTFMRLASIFGNLPALKRYVAGAAQYFSQLLNENATLEHALKFHLTTVKRRPKIKKRTYITWLKLQSLIFKMFYAIPDFAYALQSRYNRCHDFIDLDISEILVDLRDFRANRTGAVIERIQLPKTQTPSSLLDISNLNQEQANAIIDVLSGTVPHIRGSVVGEIWFNNETDFVAFDESAKYTISRYVGGSSTARQLLGPTVEFEILGNLTNSPRALAALRYWGLETLEHRSIGQLSGGQRVRLALASAMASESRIILLDNVKGQLDSEGRILLADWIAQEAEAHGRFFVSYDSHSSDDEPLSLDAAPGAARSTQYQRGRSGGDVVANVKDLQLMRGGRVLLDGFSHVFRRRELTLVTGPNGSGKTSLALALGGAIRPHRGEIQIEGPVGMSFQHPMEQVFSFTVGEELAVRPKLADDLPAEYSVAVQDQLARLCLQRNEEIIFLAPHALRTLSIESMTHLSQFMILDEPSNGLTYSQILDLRDRIYAMLDGGISILLISHDPKLWHFDHHIKLT